MAKLWQKNYTLNSLIEDFTIGVDYQLDQNLISSDCFASMAHAVMLHSIGILDDKEIEGIKEILIEIIKINEKGDFKINKSDEDGHTAIEAYLVEKLGTSGKRIHTGRSRNDQVVTALRLYARDFLNDFETSCLELVATLIKFAEKNKNIPMPGRTHMQKAMPSSVGLWAASFAEQVVDELEFIKLSYKMNNKSSLGSAASYGVPLPLDRELVSDLLGFDEVQNNVLYVQNTRGKSESIILDSIEQIVISLSKIAQDLILFTMPEFAYFTLPDQLCTGSSIMPQKKNPDALELMRAKASALSSYTSLIKNVIRNLPSGYNRDSQETKEPFMKGLTLGLNCVEIMKLTFEELKVNEENLIKGFTPEIYATDVAIELVAKGMPFRDAYKEVGTNIDKLENRDPYETIDSKKSTGTTGNLRLEKTVKKISEMKQELEERKLKVSKAKEELIGFDVSFY